MKKKILLILLILTSFFLTGCMSKEVINADTFKKVLEENNYEVNDTTESYQMQTTFKKVLIAIKEPEYIQIDFYEFEEEETAIQIYENQKMIIEGSAVSSSHTNVEAINYDKYEQTSDGQYGVVVRVENTVVYALVHKDYKEEVQSVLEKLGY